MGHFSVVLTVQLEHQELLHFTPTTLKLGVSKDVCAFFIRSLRLFGSPGCKFDFFLSTRLQGWGVPMWGLNLLLLRDSV